MSREGYHGRIGVTERHVTLKAVTGADEGSYTIRDDKGDIRKKECLNVKGESADEDRYLFPGMTFFKRSPASIRMLS